MKKAALILGTTIVFIISVLFLIGCGNTEQHSQKEAAEHMDGQKHMEGQGHMGHMEGQEHHEAEGEESDDHEHEHAENSHMGGHMQHMNDVRSWLKKELGEKYEQPVPPATKEELASGKKVFTTICASCHGLSGKGDGPAAAALPTKPADFTDPEHSKYYSDRGRIHIIENGIPGSPMVGWANTLSEKEIRDVYKYVRSLRSTDEAGDHDHGGHEH